MATELIVERTLFGPQMSTVPLHKVAWPELVGPKVYCLSYPVVGATEFRLTLREDLVHPRIFPKAEEPALRALAQARLDHLVLRSPSIFVGRQLAAQGPDSHRMRIPVRVDRLLYGAAPPKGTTVFVSGENDPLPSEGDAIYFSVEDPDENSATMPHFRLFRRWPVSEVPVVEEALKRRSLHPVTESVEDGGHKIRTQQILFQGTRAEAIELLGSTSRGAQALGFRRLLHDGPSAVPDVIAAIEGNLLRPQSGAFNEFGSQEGLISVLSIFEKGRTDGEVVRLIGSILDQVQAGATSPTDRVPNAYDQLDSDNNHSLAWLLLGLEDRDAARLFGERLLKLRDLAAYGWKDEIQQIVDRSHIEDHLALAALQPSTAYLKPVQWAGGIRQGTSSANSMAAHSGAITQVAFVENDTRLRTKGDDGVVCQWLVMDGKLVERIESPVHSEDRSLDDRQSEWFLTEDRSREFRFEEGTRLHKYSPPTTFTISTAPPGNYLRSRNPGGEYGDATRAQNQPTILGDVSLRWGQHFPRGLVPDGSHFFIGTHVFRRDNLALVSASHVSDDLRQIVFSADGSRYALVTVGHDRWGSGPQDDDDLERHRVRVHDAHSARTLLSIDFPRLRIGCVGLNHTGTSLAIIGNDNSIQLWPVPMNADDR